MRKVIQAGLTCIVVIMVMILVACGGGGGNGSGGGGNNGGRQVSVSFTPGQPATLTDAKTGMSVTLAKDALAKATSVGATFTETWPSKPASTIVQPLTLATMSTDIVGQATLTYPVGSQVSQDLIGVWTDDDQTWHPAKTAVNGSNVVVTVPDDTTRSRSILGFIRFGLMLIPGKVVDTTSGIVKLDGVGDPSIVDVNSGTVAILVHGMNNTVDNMRAMSSWLVSNKVVDTTYAFAYDWSGKTIEANGQLLANVIKTVPAGKKVIVIAHSMGGLVASYAVEQVEGVSSRVSTLVLLGVPRQGTPIASLAALPSGNDGLLLNLLNDLSGTSEQWALVRGYSTDSVKEMIPNSAFLTQLNSNHPYHTNVASYILVAGSKGTWAGGIGDVLCFTCCGAGVTCDGLVPASSLLDYEYGWVTMGWISKLKCACTHSELVTDQTVFSTMQSQLAIIGDTAKLYGSVTVDNNGTASVYGWPWSIYFTNGSLVNMIFDSIVFEAFDRSGVLLATQWWLSTNPPGELFPEVPTSPNLTLAPGQSQTLSLFTWFDHAKDSYYDVPWNLQAYSVIVSCAAHDASGRGYSWSQTVMLKDMSGNAPSAPRSVSPVPGRAAGQGGGVTGVPSRK